MFKLLTRSHRSDKIEKPNKPGQVSALMHFAAQIMIYNYDNTKQREKSSRLGFEYFNVFGSHGYAHYHISFSDEVLLKSYKVGH